MNTPQPWQIGAAQADITPDRPQFLFGYPHVERYSTGVHDPLLASAMYVAGARRSAAIFINCDVIFLARGLVHRARQRIAAATGLPGEHVMITASHTHSGPVTVSMVSNGNDPTVPAPDARYLTRLEDSIVHAAVQARTGATPATLDFALADGSELGTNRRDPAGPSIPGVPVLIARDRQSRAPLALMAVVSMHPTVLHEDWTLVSGDFPGLARQWLQQSVADCPFIYHMGASGNQSPRHVVRANTIDEARRLGQMLGQAVASAIEHAQPIAPGDVACMRVTVDLPLRPFPTAEQARRRLEAAAAQLEQLRRRDAPRTAIRTAECDRFGAEETLALAQASEQGRLAEVASTCSPAEVQVVQLGDRAFVGWPGEVFVEFALQLMRRYPRAHVITLANGELQGYLVTREAVDEGGYEAGNAIFASPESGVRLVRAAADLLQRLSSQRSLPCPSS
ncbi:MAG: neutral/alkaline non-lysosomal ceramidase N-terminal domain-containing protein [Phycisphaeraceae bacterium]